MTAILRAVAGIMLAAAVLPAAAQTYRDARTAAGEAREAMNRGDWEGAGRVLESARRTCFANRAGRACRLLVDFNLGHLFQQRARAEGARTGTWLESAVAAYRRVLAERPDHAATLNNLALALRDLGRADVLNELVDHAGVSAPDEAPAIAMLLGDLQIANGRWKDAYGAYEIAARMAPGDEAPRLKMAQVYRDTATASIPGFRDAVASWEGDFPRAARDGYLAIVGHSGDEASGPALVRWVTLMANQRLLNGRSAGDALKPLDSAPAREFLAFLGLLEGGGEGRFDNADWVRSYVRSEPSSRDYPFWMASEERRHALALAALAFGRDSVVAQRWRLAERQWMLGLRYAPRAEAYIYGGLRRADFAPLDLVTELAWLEFRYPGIDPGERKFDLFIRLLFEGKAQAYEANDLRTIQRHHTVLGEIYAAKGRWKSGWADNAVFQLSHAIDVAERRRKSEGLYQPLPGLKARLSEGYEKTGQAARAAVTAIDASQAYLDTDDLDRAARMLSRVSDAPARERARKAALEEVLDLRRTIAAEQRDAKPGGSISTNLTVNRVASRLAALQGLPDDFLARQRFKIDADLADIGARIGAESLTRIRADAALSQADRAQQLIGTADILRMERLSKWTVAPQPIPEAIQEPAPPVRAPVAPELKPDDGASVKPEQRLPEKPVRIFPIRPDRISPTLNRLPSGASRRDVQPADRSTVYVPAQRGVVAVRPSAGTWRIPFGNDSAALSRETEKIVRQAAAIIGKSRPRGKVWVLGRTDFKGDPRYNLALSKRRAQAVAEALVRHGVARGRVVVQAMGEQKTNGAAAGRVVEITLD